ncbi:hypothetical protein HDU85_003506 [Gaertneriomyces sp. JEL0708]|nr:hypothetical protein HDU85_003506 [Gaertneriomyces sp. JEL0708]
MSFLKKLVSSLGAGGQAAQAPTRIFPSERFFLSAVNARDQWLSHCINQPLYHAPTNVRVHLLGSSLLNIPPAADIRQVRPQLKGEFSWLCIDQAHEDAAWLNQYAEILKKSPVGEYAGNDMEEFLAGVRSWSERMRGDFINIGVPDEIIDALEVTGLFPFWDAVEAVDLGQDEGVPVEFIGLGSAEERQRIAIHMATNRILQLDDAEIVGDAPALPGTDMQDELKTLFRSVDVEPRDVKEIDTGSPLADSRLQNLVLGPEMLARYNGIVTRHLLSLNPKGPAKEKWLKADASRHVKCERIVEGLKDACEEVAANGPVQDAFVLAVVDRNNVDGVRKLWETEEEVN